MSSSWPSLGARQPDQWEVYPQAGMDAAGFVALTGSTRTPVFPSTLLGVLHKGVKVELINTSGSNVAMLYVDRLPDGTIPRDDTLTVLVPAGKSLPIELADTSDAFFSADVSGDPGGGFLSVTGKLRVLVRKRYLP